jgi:ABC transport system ATP-binding/permease protein
MGYALKHWFRFDKTSLAACPLIFDKVFMLNARNLRLSFGSRILLDDISLTLLPKERIALVGQNGAGKSSLLKVLAGEPPDGGLVEMSKNVRVGYLQQLPDLDANATVLDTIRLGMGQHLKDIAEHQRLCQQLALVTDAANADKLHKRIDALSHTIEQGGGFDVDYWVERVLTRLGIVARTQTIGTLSGGERRRVDLARILLSAPDIYLLDEPTNHLDISAIEFLIETFMNISAPLLFVSHDRAFIDELATRIVELDKGKLYTHEPPFANYLENKLVRELIDERTLHRRERLVVGELAWLRAGTPARTTKQNARIDRAYALIDQVAKGIETQRKQGLQAEIAQAKRLGSTILELDHVGASYGDRILFRDFSLKVVARQRYGILGKNGSGKTTLLSMLAQKMAPSEGVIVCGKNTEIIEFDQQRAQLDQEATLKETLADHGDYVIINNQNIHIASYLERYLFSGSDGNRRVSTLSGGEQNRLLLAKLFRHPGNCLLLDEPTNDLDMESLAVLEEVLLGYEGVVFIISHDRKFLDRVCTNIIAFIENVGGVGESKLVVYPGNYSDYVHLRALADKDVAKTLVAPKKIIETPKVKKRRSFKEEREFQAIEGEIEGLEKERAALHAELAQGDAFKQNPGLVQTKIARLEQVEHAIENLYARWQELADMGG